MSSLHQAAKRGDNNAIKLALSILQELAPKDTINIINKKDKNQKTPLYYAAEYGHKDVVVSLITHVLKNNPDALINFINTHDNDYITPLFISASKGHLDIVTYLLDMKATKMQGYPLYKSVIQFASEGQHMDVVTHLLEIENIQPKDKDNRVSLPSAVFLGDKNVVVSLIQKEVQKLSRQFIKDYINSSKNEIGDTALHTAAEKGDIDTLTYLLDHDAEYNAKNNDNKTPLHYAAEKGHKDVVVSLITHAHNKNPDTLVQYINNKNTNGYTAVLYAASEGHLDIVTYLLDKGGKFNAKDKHKVTPLHYAAVGGHKNVVESLITHVHNNNPDILVHYINQRDDRGFTPLNYAINGNVDVVKYLLDKGAEYNTKDKFNKKTPIHWAAEEGHKDVIQSLITHVQNNNPDILEQYINERKACRSSPLYIAVINGKADAVECLLKNGANFNAKDEYNLLHYAAMWGHKDVTVSLTSHVHNNHPDTFKQFITEKDKYGNTALYYATKRGDKDVVVYLITQLQNYYPDIKQIINDENQLNALYHAAMHGHIDVVTCLLDQGAKYDITDKDNNTMLHCAVKEGHKDVIVSLITHIRKNNPDTLVQYINEKDKYGRTALSYATYPFRNEEIRKFLIDNGALYNEY